MNAHTTHDEKSSWRYPAGVSLAEFEGEHGKLPLRRGLSVHFCTGTDRHDHVAEAELPAGLALYLFLAGRPDATLGGRPLLPELPGGGQGPQAVLVSRAQPELLVRRSHYGNYASKVAITVSADWLADSGLDIKGDGCDIGAFAQRHMAQMSWHADRGLSAAADYILHASPFTGALSRLHLESRVIELLARAFSHVAGSLPALEAGTLKIRDRQRVRRVEDFILEGNHQGNFTLAELADHAGVSVSTLQRLFVAVHGISPVDYIRRARLEQARQALRFEGISVKEAAFRAGYSTTANFSTAFRRQYGYPPGVETQG